MKVKELKNADTYTKLILYAFQTCNIVMLAQEEYNKIYYYTNFEKQELKKLSKNLKKFKKSLIKIETEDNILIYRKNMIAYFYKTDEKLKNYLLSKNSLYDWKYPSDPTDITFFKDNECWLRSISHELMCDIAVKDLKEYEYLKEIGIVFYEKQFKKTPKKNIIKIK